MNNDKLLAPVTDELITELGSTESLLTKMDGKAASRNSQDKLNDRDDFAAVVVQLECLVRSVLAAPTVVSILAPVVSGPRIDVGYSSELTAHVHKCVTYLRAEASGILNGVALNRHASNNTEDALSQLKHLYNLVLVSIKRQAAADLEELRLTDTVGMVAAATMLGGMVNEVRRLKAEASAPDQPADR